MTGRTETWFDDHPEREQIAAVLIDYFLNGLGLEWIEQQLERFSSGALWYESGHAGALLYGWMAEPKYLEEWMTRASLANDRTVRAR